MKVKLKESYAQQYWDSANGVTLSKGEIIEVDENNQIVRHALDSGILEVVVEKKDELNIISDVPNKKTISEVITPSKVKSNKEAILEAKEKPETNATIKPTDKGDKL